MEQRIQELLLMGGSEQRVAAILAEYETNNGCFIKTFPADAPVAVLAYRLIDDVVEILDIAVDPVHRGQGIGSLLIRQVIANHLPQQVVAETDDDAVNFYRKVGFNTVPFESQWGTIRYKMDLNCKTQSGGKIDEREQ